MFACVCFQVTDTEVRHAIRQGYTTVEGLTAHLGFGTRCKRCIEAYITRILEDELKGDLEIRGP